MDRLTRYVPTIAIFILSIPFLLLLSGVTDKGFVLNSETVFGTATLAILKFVFTDPAFGQAIAYLQAPLMLAIVLRYHSPEAQHLPGNQIIQWPNNLSTWVLVAICLIAAIVAYLTRYTFFAENCAADNYCRYLSESIDVDLATNPGGVTADLQRYCSGLIASSTAAITGVFVGARKA